MMTSNILELSKDLLDPELQHELVETRTINANEYALIEQTGEDEGALSLIEITDGQPRLLSADILGDTDLGAIDPAVLQEFSVGADLLDQAQQPAIPPLDTEDPDPSRGPAPGTTVQTHGGARKFLDLGSLLAAIHNLAVWGTTPDGQVEMNSRDNSPAATRRGRLACAWAVNRIVTFALQRPVGGDLSSARMGEVLRDRDQAVNLQEAKPGAIIISPTRGSNVGHVGILGEGGLIYSNSSSMGNWKQNRTITSWNAYYHAQKGLPVLFYHLDPARFPMPAFPVS